MDNKYPENPAERSAWILKHRPAHRRPDHNKPANFFLEFEPGQNGGIMMCATVIVVNRECSWCCVMCDLWKNTTTYVVPAGAVPRQIQYGLEQLGKFEGNKFFANQNNIVFSTDDSETDDSAIGERIPVDVLKIYNAGSFFDPSAIPPEDYHDIAEVAGHFNRLIVECHPSLISPRIEKFNQLLHLRGTVLEIALGLETVHPVVLEKLNKRMRTEDFAEACAFLKARDIDVRSFVLINPPFMAPGIMTEWAVKSAKFSFECGAKTVVLIPVRSGDGAIEALSQQGEFFEASLGLIESAYENAFKIKKGLLLVDLWDIERLRQSECPQCFDKRIERLARMNLSQKFVPLPKCKFCGL